MDAGKRFINDIFNGNRILEVPFFQRSYVWKEEQWERFLTDMETVSEGDESYFMGAVILKQEMTNASSVVGDRRLVIDGQQRMTTLSILMKVLSLKTNRTPQFERQFMLLGGHPVLQHNHNDEEAYNKVMSLSEEMPLNGQDGITKVYEYFRQHADVNKLNYEKICNKIQFVGIDLNYDEDEQQIFDTINSLGVRLTTAELLKNYFFGRNELEDYNTNWLGVFEKDEETRAYWDREVTTGRLKRTFIDLFFYAFLLIKIQDSAYGVSTEDKIRFSKVDKLFESYKAFIKKYANGDKSSIFGEIRDYADVFHKKISDAILWQDLSAKEGISRINTVMFGLDTMTLLPYVLFVEKNVDDEDAKNAIYGYLESYIMRRMVCQWPTKNYNRLFSEKLILNRVLTREAMRQTLFEENSSDNRMPSDEEVKEAFHTKELINKYSAGVLYMIESRIRDRDKQSTTLLGLKKYSLEHMMPKKWRNHWNYDGATEAEKKERDHILLTLGNLTIITQSLNISVRDDSWEEKKKGNNSTGGLEKYSKGIETVSEYLNYPVWDENTISERADYLAEKALEIWKA